MVFSPSVSLQSSRLWIVVKREISTKETEDVAWLLPRCGPKEQLACPMCVLLSLPKEQALQTQNARQITLCPGQIYRLVTTPICSLACKVTPTCRNGSRSSGLLFASKQSTKLFMSSRSFYRGSKYKFACDMCVRGFAEGTWIMQTGYTGSDSSCPGLVLLGR